MSYFPDKDAVLDGTSFTRQLSQRDLSLQVPINRVTVAGVALTPTCFVDQRYEETAAIKCLSNLLAVGFRRFEIDAYWDASRNIWSICPVQLGDLSTNDLATRDGLHIGRPEVHGEAINLFPRQDDGDSATRSLTLTSTATLLSTQSLTSASTTVSLDTGSTAATSPPPATTGTAGDGTAIHVGNYTCTPSATLELLLKVVSTHLDSTQTNVNATINYLILNLHEATSPYDRTSNPVGDLPHGHNYLSSIVRSPATNISEYLYTPDDLRDQRADLNASFSWFSVNPSQETESAYFTVDKRGGNDFTLNGWPAESFVEMTQAKRMLVGVGEVDAQLRDYNLSADASTIFRPGYLSAPSAVELATDGQLTSGCFFTQDVTAVSNINNSWARVALESTAVTALTSDLTAANSLADCGITPILDVALGGRTADEDFEPYKDYVQRTIWAWAPGEPRNNSNGVDDPSTYNRCAVLNALSGYWQVDDCAVVHHSACLVPGQPYKWTISSRTGSYANAERSCDDGTVFETPRTGLENRYLLHAWRNAIAERNFDANSLLWVNFNDLDAKACWVVGQNATCPYLKHSDHARKVVVPVVAGVIVFVLAALTVFVKCASNRQTVKRRRRRGDDGWDYEGVPS